MFLNTMLLLLKGLSTENCPDLRRSEGWTFFSSFLTFKFSLIWLSDAFTIMDLVILFNPDCSQSLCVFMCITEKKKKKLTANMEPVKQDGAPTHTTSLERWKWGKGAVERFSKRRAIFCDFRGGAEGEKKNLPLLQHHREGFMIHRLAHERQINTHWTVQSFPRLSPPPLLPLLIPPPHPSLPPSFPPAERRCPRPPLTSPSPAARRGGPGTFIFPWFSGANAASIRLRQGCRAKILRDAFCWRSSERAEQFWKVLLELISVFKV